MKKLQLLKYRMKIRKALSDANIEELRICYEETKRMVEIRDKQTWKKRNNNRKHKIITLVNFLHSRNRKTKTKHI